MQSIRFRAYRSTQDKLNGSESLIGEQEITDPSLLMADKSHQAQILRGRVLAPNTNKPFVVVVAEANGKTSSTYFRKRLIAALVHGYTFRYRLALARSIGENAQMDPPVEKVGLEYSACYDEASFSFSWRYDSVEQLPSLLAARGVDLYREVAKTADSLARQHEGDIVDVHFIGHSRGTVMVTQALIEWARQRSSALAGSYVRVTLLDPHPANNSIPLQENIEDGDFGIVSYADYKAFQDAVRDPPVVLPANAGVREIDIWFQHTLVKDIRARRRLWDVESWISPMNLWGQGGTNDNATRFNNTGVGIKWHDLTAVQFADGTAIDHSGVTSYFTDPLLRISRRRISPENGNCVAVPH